MGRETAKEIWSRSTDRRPSWRILDGIKGAGTVRRQCAKFVLIARLVVVVVVVVVGYLGYCQLGQRATTRDLSASKTGKTHMEVHFEDFNIFSAPIEINKRKKSEELTGLTCPRPCPCPDPTPAPATCALWPRSSGLRNIIVCRRSHLTCSCLPHLYVVWAMRL